MQFNFASVALFAGFVSAGALPRGESAAQAITHIFVCTDGNFAGTCNNFEVQTGACLNFVPPFQDSISSAGPDQGTTCTLFQDSNCLGRSLTFGFPGIPHLGDPAFNFGDIASSVRCTI